MNEQAKKQAARLFERLAAIRQSAGAPSLDLTVEQQQRFAQYVRLLLEWNQRINLISLGDEDRIAERHILESLAVLSVWPFLEGASVLDLGSGGGFPGIPLKIMRPDFSMTLLESRQKKALFLNTVVRELKLDDCRVVNARAEELARSSGEQFSIVIARAVAELKTLWEWSKPLLGAGGVLLAMKGGELDDELQALMKLDSRVEYRVLQYPEGWEVEASRCLVVVSLLG
jgi:16S rRNA (guanine527-N7)-methyltransferase